jgi:DNA-binding IclR family transcriptional regulator
MPESRGVQSIEVGSRLLEALAFSPSPVALKDLAAKADIPSAQAHVYLTSYKKLGLVDQDRATGRYRIGPFAMRLALSRLRSDVPLRLGCEAAAELNAQLGATVTMTVWGCGAPTVVLVHDGPEDIHINLRAGRVYNVTTTATGRLFAAYRRDRDVKERLATELAASPGQDRKAKQPSSEFKAAVAAARNAGYTRASGVPIPGVAALAAPVLDPNGEISFALTIIGPQATLDVNPEGRPLRTLLSKTLDIAERAYGTVRKLDETLRA